jgi:ketosteroid isomerase-like protein
MGMTQRDEDAIAQVFTDYLETFQKLDPAATLPYFHVPCMFLAPAGVRVLANTADIDELLTQVMAGLKARGYARSELLDRQVKQMSAGAAFVSVSRARYTTDGRELERLGETYTLRKTDGGWKIVVAMIHDPGCVVR